MMDRQEQKAEIIKKARALRSKGLSAKQTALELSKLGYVSPFSGKPYAVSWVKIYTNRCVSIPVNEQLFDLVVSLRVNGLRYREIALELYNLGYKDVDGELYSQGFLSKICNTDKAREAILKAKAEARAEIKKNKADKLKARIKEKKQIKADRRKARIEERKQKAVVKALINKLNKKGYQINHIELVLRAEGFINPNTGRPYDYNSIYNIICHTL
jgi:hypothetical protein